MTYLLVGDPAVEPVSVPDAKRHMRLDHDRDDDLIGGLIAAARRHVEHETGIAVMLQTWRLYLDSWPADRCIRLRRHPVRRVESVTVFDADGTPKSLLDTSLRLDAVSRPARLMISDALPPEAATNGIEIEFTAGLAELPPEVPDDIVRAILLLVAQWYEFRGAFSASDQPVAIPTGVERLIAPYRAHRI